MFFVLGTLHSAHPSMSQWATSMSRGQQAHIFMKYEPAETKNLCHVKTHIYIGPIAIGLKPYLGKGGTRHPDEEQR